MTPEQRIADMRTAHVRLPGNPAFCWRCGQKWPCDTSVAVVHIDTLTAAVEAAQELAEAYAPDRDAAANAMRLGELRAAVLAILNGETP